MPRQREPKQRNPMVLIGRMFGRQRIEDKRLAERERVLDEMVEEAQRLGLYDLPEPVVNAAERAMLMDRRLEQRPFKGPEKREYIEE